MRRVFIDGLLADEIKINGTDGHHIIHVLRAKIGQKLIVVDASQTIAEAEIIAARDRHRGGVERGRQRHAGVRARGVVEDHAVAAGRRAVDEGGRGAGGVQRPVLGGGVPSGAVGARPVQVVAAAGDRQVDKSARGR